MQRSSAWGLVTQHSPFLPQSLGPCVMRQRAWAHQRATAGKPAFKILVLSGSTVLRLQAFTSWLQCCLQAFILGFPEKA